MGDDAASDKQRRIAAARSRLAEAKEKLRQAEAAGDPGAKRRAQSDIAEARTELHQLGVDPDAGTESCGCAGCGCTFSSAGLFMLVVVTAITAVRRRR